MIIPLISFSQCQNGLASINSSCVNCTQRGLVYSRQNPGFCQCKDPGADISTNCTACLTNFILVGGSCSTCAQGYGLTAQNQCVLCTSVNSTYVAQGQNLNGTCSCTNSVGFFFQQCTACYALGFGIVNGICTNCSTVNSSSQLNANNFNISACVCADMNANISTSCTVCDYGYVKDGNGLCSVCDQNFGQYNGYDNISHGYGSCIFCSSYNALPVTNKAGNTCSCLNKADFSTDSCRGCNQTGFGLVNNVCVNCTPIGIILYGQCQCGDENENISNNCQCNKGWMLYSNFGSPSRCQKCMTGWDIVDGTSSCVPCSQYNATYNANISACTCINTSISFQNYCMSCSAGETVVNKSCVCQVTQANISTNCQSCNNGYITENGWACSSCTNGFVMLIISAINQQCVPCYQVNATTSQNGTCVCADPNALLSFNCSGCISGYGPYFGQNGSCGLCKPQNYVDGYCQCINRMLDPRTQCNTYLANYTKNGSCSPGYASQNGGWCILCQDISAMNVSGVCQCRLANYDPNHNCAQCLKGFTNTNEMCLNCSSIVGATLRDGICVCKNQYADVGTNCSTCLGGFGMVNGECQACAQYNASGEDGICTCTEPSTSFSFLCFQDAYMFIAIGIVIIVYCIGPIAVYTIIFWIKKDTHKSKAFSLRNYPYAMVIYEIVFAIIAGIGVTQLANQISSNAYIILCIIGSIMYIGDLFWFMPMFCCDSQTCCEGECKRCCLGEIEAARNKRSLLETDGFLQHLRKTCPVPSIYVSCWHTEVYYITTTITDSNGHKTTTRERREKTVVTYTEYIYLKVTGWYDETPPLSVELPTKAKQIHIHIKSAIDWSDETERIISYQKTNAYLLNRWRDDHCDVSFSVNVPGVIQHNYLVDRKVCQFCSNGFTMFFALLAQLLTIEVLWLRATTPSYKLLLRKFFSLEIEGLEVPDDIDVDSASIKVAPNQDQTQQNPYNFAYPDGAPQAERAPNGQQGAGGPQGVKNEQNPYYCVTPIEAPAFIRENDKPLCDPNYVPDYIQNFDSFDETEMRNATAWNRGVGGKGVDGPLV